jgi:peptide/nickel transport system ATP-binding protein
MNEQLKIRGLTVKFYTYEGIVLALDNLDLDIYQRETFGLVGETGCGKSMTAFSILRIVPPPGKIESGNLFFRSDDNNGYVDLLTLSEKKMRSLRGSSISMIFQEPGAALNPVFTIGNQIAEALLLHRGDEINKNALSSVNELLNKEDNYWAIILKPFRHIQKYLYTEAIKKPDALLIKAVGKIPIVSRFLSGRQQTEANKMAIQSLKGVEISDPERIVSQYPHQLSGGMKQRSVIAMALACCPKLLIADEPTTSLDVTIQAQILELIYRLKEDMGSSVLYITHDLAVAAEICDRIGVMYSGSLCELGRVGDIYSNPLHPYTKALMAAVPKPGVRPQAIGGFVPDPLNLPIGCRFHPRCEMGTPKCKEEFPVMREITSGHFVACFYAR